MRRPYYRPAWWTRERVITGLLRFWRERGTAPTSYTEWRLATACRGKAMRRRYPSATGIAQFWPNMRAAWVAVGVLIDRSHLPWTELEDWYLREAAGIILRAEIARDLRRSPQAIHRRLFDLGLNSYQIHGWALHRIERAARLPMGYLKSRMCRGKLTIPARRGSKSWIVDPADLVDLRAIDWTRVSFELEAATRRSLARRLVCVLARREEAA